MHAELIDDHDERLSVNRVARLMARAGIECISGRSRRPRTTTPPADRRAKPPDRVQTRYIEFRYNTRRIHSGLGYRTPQEIYDEHLNRPRAA